MIKIENVEVIGWEHTIRGMRNPMNSWSNSDSGTGCTMVENDDCFNNDYINCDDCRTFKVGPNDHELMMKLAAGGPVHAKYRRMIVVYLDITAPLYWWKEFDTYKVGTVANSCSTMHKIAEKKFTLDDFSFEKVFDEANSEYILSGMELCRKIIFELNSARECYLKTKDKSYWWQMIQLLPSSYNQKRTIMLNYEVLASIYPMRKNHKLDEWREFCQWIEQLPYSEIIIGLMTEKI